MVLGLKHMGKLDTENKAQVLNRTKALHGPQTLAYGETRHTENKVQVLDKTKALHSPWT